MTVPVIVVLVILTGLIHVIAGIITDTMIIDASILDFVISGMVTIHVNGSISIIMLSLLLLAILWLLSLLLLVITIISCCCHCRCYPCRGMVINDFV